MGWWCVSHIGTVLIRLVRVELEPGRQLGRAFPALGGSPLPQRLLTLARPLRQHDELPLEVR